MASSIDGFVRSTRLWHRLFQGGASLATHGLAVGVLLLVADFFWRGAHAWLSWSGFGWLFLVLVYQALRRRHTVQQADRELGLRDQLITWCSCREQAVAPVALWLEDELASKLDALPPASCSPLWRRQARRLWWLLPMLLLVWWIGPLGRSLLLESPRGETQQADVGERRDGSPRPGPGPGGGAASGRSGERPVAAPPQPAEPDTPGQDEPKAPPRPLVVLPAQDEFVIPRFVGDGDGEKKRMQVAVIEAGEAQAGGRRRRNTSAVPRPEQRLEFEAAAERAQRARHVPAAERAFVKRYFEALLEGRR